MEKIRVCKHCNKKFKNSDMNKRVFANHVRWCDANPNSSRSNPSYINKMRKTVEKTNTKTHGKKIMYDLTCCKCGKKIKREIRERTFEKNKANDIKYFCSVYCATSYSSSFITTEQRRKGGLNNTYEDRIDKVSRSLKSREARRYVEVKKYLEARSIKHEFEYVVENRVYDLFLFNLKVLIEFDGKYHGNGTENDKYKNRLAKDNGLRLIRIKTADKVYPSNLIEAIISI